MRNNSLQKSVIGSLSETIKQISLPNKSRSHSGAHLTLMNLPHWLSKRDVKFHKAIYLIKNNLNSKSSLERDVSYSKIIKLLKSTLTCHQRILINLEQNKKKRKIEYLSEHLKLIINMISSASLLCGSEEIIESTTTNSINESIISVNHNIINKINLYNMESEKKLYESILTLIPLTEKILTNDSNKIIHLLPQSDRDRYKDAYKELEKDI